MDRWVHDPGARPGGVLLVPHDPRWSKAFAQERAALEGLIGPGLIAVHHIGSTAIAGIPAKPIIDMQAVVTDVGVLEAATAALEGAGYEAKGEYGLPGRRYFRKTSPGGVRTHHLHGYGVTSPEIERHLAFRDALIERPELADAYARLKIELAGRLGLRGDAYSDAKTEFIRAVERGARTAP